MVFVLAVISAITAAVKYSGKRKREKEAKNSEDLLQQGIYIDGSTTTSDTDSMILSIHYTSVSVYLVLRIPHDVQYITIKMMIYI